jgi:hypothetical protein
MKSIVSQTNSVFVCFDYFDLLSLYIFMTRTHRHLFHSKDVCPPPLLFLTRKEEEGAYIF